MKKFKWVVEIEVDGTWVADGFRLDDERASEMARKEIPYAYSYEVTAKVLRAPSLESVMKIQGYSQAEIQLAQDSLDGIELRKGTDKATALHNTSILLD